MIELNPREVNAMGEVLKSCPHCGKSVGAVVSAAEMWPDDPEASDSSFAVFCDAQKPRGPGGCGASGGFAPSKEEATAAWNRRAASPVAADTMGDAKERVAMFDAFGNPRKRYTRVSLDGAHLIVDDVQLAEFKAEQTDAPEQYSYTHVYLSQEEADALPEFDGF